MSEALRELVPPEDAQARLAMPDPHDDKAQERSDRRKKARPLCYVSLLPPLMHAARERGYALAVHGSLVRDLDLIAVPWTDEAVAPDELVAALMLVCGGYFTDGARNVDGKWQAVDGTMPIKKPHGRMAWPIHTGAELYIDLSVMPRAQ